jgi:putative SOS response-associated peptidase YedK
MCGRYRLAIPLDELMRIFTASGGDELGLKARWNVAPTDLMPIVTDSSAGRVLRLAKWGITPPWAAGRPGFINARAETVESKFRDAFRRSRCIVPADGFYEWRVVGKQKHPVMYRPREGGVLGLAGLWDRGSPDRPPSYTVLTTEPNRLCAEVHDRMPAVLAPAAWAIWLDPDATSDDLHQVIGPAPDELLEAVPVSPLVNSVKNDVPECAMSLQPPRSDQRSAISSQPGREEQRPGVNQLTLGLPRRVPPADR